MSYLKKKKTRRAAKRMIEKEGKCKYCGTEYNLTIDHIIPVSKGGVTAQTNWQVLCKKCNNKKGDSYPQIDCLTS